MSVEEQDRTPHAAAVDRKAAGTARTLRTVDWLSSAWGSCGRLDTRRIWRRGAGWLVVGGFVLRIRPRRRQRQRPTEAVYALDIP